MRILDYAGEKNLTGKIRIRFWNNKTKDLYNQLSTWNSNLKEKNGEKNSIQFFFSFKERSKRQENTAVDPVAAEPEPKNNKKRRLELVYSLECS